MAVKTTAQILRDYRGPALFSFGFRPFFLAAAFWSALAVPLWIAALLSGNPALSALFTREWHVHELLFGYTGAVIVGYLTVAGANWTGRFPVAGRPILFLILLWICGRAAMLALPDPPVLAVLVETAFLVLFALALWREQIAARNWRSLPPCIIVSLLALSDLMFHASADWRPLSERMAIALIAFLVAMVGGRLVPSFTRNWMAQRKMKPEPPPYGRWDHGAMVLIGLGLGAWILFPYSRWAGGLLLLAGAAALGRMVRWRGWATWPEPMVWILHSGYFWLAFGLFLLGLSILTPFYLQHSAAVHALTAGAIGVMTLAVMTRTSRSHTGRPRVADGATVVLYLLVNVAALARVASPFMNGVQFELLALSALCWSLAFALFVYIYGPMLISPWKRKS